MAYDDIPVAAAVSGSWECGRRTADPLHLLSEPEAAVFLRFFLEAQPRSRHDAGVLGLRRSLGVLGSIDARCRLCFGFRVVFTDLAGDFGFAFDLDIDRTGLFNEGGFDALEVFGFRLELLAADGRFLEACGERSKGRWGGCTRRDPRRVTGLRNGSGRPGGG